MHLNALGSPTMKAIGYRKSHPIDAADALIDFETTMPEPQGRDIRVAIKAVSVNPVDTKVRKRAAPPEGETKILGHDATVIATASRPETTKWCLDLGAHAVVDHARPMKEQIEKLKLPPVAVIASLTGSEQHYPALADILAPQGKFGLIDDPATLNVSLLKAKACSLHWESMFTRSS